MALESSHGRAYPGGEARPTKGGRAHPVLFRTPDPLPLDQQFTDSHLGINLAITRRATAGAAAHELEHARSPRHAQLQHPALPGECELVTIVSGEQP